MEIATRLDASGVIQGGPIFDESPTPRIVWIRSLLVAVTILIAVVALVIVLRRRNKNAPAHPAGQ